MRYEFGGLIFGGAYTREAYFRNLTVLLETKTKVLKNDEHVAFLKRNILYRLISMLEFAFCIKPQFIPYIVNVVGD